MTDSNPSNLRSTLLQRLKTLPLSGQYSLALQTEAADEIERLTRERDMANTQLAKILDGSTAVLDERDRLRAELEAVTTWYGLENEAARKRGTRPADETAAVPYCKVCGATLPLTQGTNHFSGCPDWVDRSAVKTTGDT